MGQVTARIEYWLSLLAQLTALRSQPVSNVVVYLGPVRSGKTHKLLRLYRQTLREHEGGRVSFSTGDTYPRKRLAVENETRPLFILDRTLWLAPNSRTATIIRGQLLADGLDACLSPGVMTFDDLTRLILADVKTRLRPLSPLAERALLRRVVEHALQKDELTFFADAARRPAFVELLADHIAELKRGDVSSDAYAKIRSPRGDAQQHHELAGLYRDYERLLTTHALMDRNSAHGTARDLLAAGASRRFQHLELIVVDGFTDFTRTQHDILRLLAQRAKQLLISLPADANERAPQRTGRLSDQSLGPSTSETFSRARPDLFAKVAATLAELRREHAHLEIRQLAPRPLAWPALDHVAQHIFRNPADVPAPSAEALDTLNRLEIVAAASAHDEIAQIARRIKQRLTGIPLHYREGLGEGSTSPRPSPNLSLRSRGITRPGDIVVVFRTLAEVAPRVREVFEQFGIPYYLESDLRIAAAPLVKTLLAVLRLDDENWPFRRVLSVITNNTLTAYDGAARQAADWLIRELQIADGRDKLLERIEQLAAVEVPLDELGEHARRRVTAAKKALPAIRLLASAFDELPNEATPTEWCDALARFAEQLGVPEWHALNPGWHALRLCEGRGELVTAPRPSKTQGVPPVASKSDANDLIAWQSIVDHFTALERLDASLDEPPRKLTRRELISALLDVTTHESLPRPHDDVGRVMVLAAPSARTIAARHLFLAGMSEQAFPSPERAGRLGTDAEYRFFSRAAHQTAAAGPELAPPMPTRAADEMLLFYEVLSRAHESLTISYPALDDKAQDLPPSPYVLEIERSFGEVNRQRLRRAAPQLSPVPQDATPCSPGDWRIQAIGQALGDKRDVRLLSGLLRDEAIKPLGDAIDAGLRIVHARAHGDSFGPAEGLLTSPAVAARLAQRFGPNHLWSPSQWETYAACPYKFFLEDVLGLAPLGDVMLETDFTRRGSRLHHVLATFHRQWPEARGGRPMSAEEERSLFLAHLHSVIDERITASPHGGIDAALLELDRRQIRKWAEKHFDHHVKYDGACAKNGGPMTPTHLEFRFGPARPGDADNDPNSTREAFVLDIDGEQIHVTGQIDRIDVGALDGRTVFNVIDYKSGKKTSLRHQDIESGERLQLPIYVVAAQALVFGGDATPLVAGYWSMTGGFDAKGALAVQQDADPVERWQAMRRTIETRIGELIVDIRRGAFPVASRDDKCTSYCDFNTVCRVAHVRSLGKTWPCPSETKS